MRPFLHYTTAMGNSNVTGNFIFFGAEALEEAFRHSEFTDTNISVSYYIHVHLEGGVPRFFLFFFCRGQDSSPRKSSCISYRRVLYRPLLDDALPTD